MEWLEHTDSSVEAAKEYLLDQLGVAEDEAQFEILEEPKAGLFGRQRGVARVRARLAPVSPRGGDRDSRQRRRSPKSGEGNDRSSAETARSEDQRSAPPQRDGNRQGPRGGEDRPRRERTPDEPMADPQTVIPAVQTFFEGITDKAGLSATTSITVEDDTIVVNIVGDGLGTLIGPRGRMIDVLQELGRTIVQKEVSSGSAPRLRLDVGGYRADRRVALGEFAKEVAGRVVEQGTPVRFEGMGSADRKAIHDAVAELDVTTSSAGEEPDRYVVMSPAN